VLADDKLHVITGDGKPEATASLKEFVYDWSGLRFASFGDIDVPAKSLAGVQVAVPEGLRPLCFSPAGDALLTVDAEGALHLHKVRAGLTQRLSLFATGQNIPRITDACYSSDGAYFFVAAAADRRISLYYGIATGQKPYSTLASVSRVSGHVSLEILGADRACVYLLADGDRVLRYRLSDKNLSTLFSTTGRITACCMISGR
jgi:WD40 repeat protein